MGSADKYDLLTMGQDVQINSTVTMDDVLIIDTDRSFTGQDGQAITTDVQGVGVPGVLATEIFDLNLGVDHVFVLQNSVTVRRPDGWDATSQGAVVDITRSFLRYYSDEEE